MKSLKIALLCVLVSMNLAACAQSKSVIRKAYATFVEHIPGNIPADREGNEIPLRDTVIVLYIETTSPDLHWQHAWLNGKTYSVISSMVDSNHIDAGIRKDNNRSIMITTAGHNKLWRLQLLREDNSAGVPLKAAAGEIILSATYRNKKVIRKIKSMTEVVGPPTP